MQPKISCIVLSKNRAKWLPRLLEIIFASTWKNLEVIIAERADSGVHADLPYRAGVTHLKMGGAGIVPRNREAMLKARGDIIAYVDDDDYFPPNRFELQVEPLLRGTCSMNGMPRSTLSSFFILENQWARVSWINNPSAPQGKDPFKGVLPALCCSDGTLMFKREKFLGPSDPGLELQKISFMRTVLTRCIFKAFDGTGLYGYLRHDRNLSQIHDANWKREPIPQPSFVPLEQIAFWHSMVKHGS